MAILGTAFLFYQKTFSSISNFILTHFLKNKNLFK